jgi:hypothetical protein
VSTIASLDPERTAEVRSIVTMMDGVLAGVVRAYEQSGIELPARRYWTLATPAHDCEQLTVTFNQAYLGIPGDDAGEPSRCNSPRSASLTVEVVRCIPTVSARGNRAPTAEQIQSGSEALAIDAWLLLDSAAQLDQWDPLGGPGLGVIATVDAREPQGGFQAVTMTLALAIP